MTAARVAKLEALLGRIARNRRPLPARPAKAEAKRPASIHPPLPTHAVVTARAAPSPPEPAPPPKPIVAPTPEPVLTPPPMEDEARPVRATRPTPMEQAVVVELETLSPREPSSVDVEISLDDDGTEVTIDADGDESLESFEGDAPTAPVEMRAPQPTPVEIIPAEPEAEEEEVLAAAPIELPAAAASQPVARTVSRHATVEPETFGELLDRTLALRPR